MKTIQLTAISVSSVKYIRQIQQTRFYRNVLRLEKI